MFKFTDFAKPYKKQFILGPAAKLTEAVFELSMPLLMANLIDNGVKAGNTEHIIRMSLLMAIVSLLGLLCALFCQYSASVASQGFGSLLRNAIMEKIDTFTYAEVDSFGTSTLINRSLNDVNQLQAAVATIIRLVIRAPFLCIGGIIMAMTVDFRLSLVLIVFIPLFIVLLYLITTKTIPLYKAVQKKLDELSLVLRENLTGIRVVRAFARSDRENERFGESNEAWMKMSLSAGRISALLSPITLIIMNMATLFIIWFGGYRVESGGLSQGQLIAFVNYITQIMLALIVISNLAIMFQKSAAAAERIKQIFETEPSIRNNENNMGYAVVKKMAAKHEIEFKNVSFRYGRDGDYALKDISFKAQNGAIVGIIGGTGAGKSTLVQLIPRFYDVSEGQILMDGIDIRDLNVEEWRDNIGVVPQKAVLFSGTIAENIRWGKADASEGDVKEAAEIARATEFIERMPEKYDTVISQGGKNLSGGQKQRLTIARAVVRKPAVLILDDSASALDYATDFALRQSLRHNCFGTTFIVSQRVNAVKDADFILVLDDGMLMGIGTHEELMDNNSLYLEICKSQKMEKEETA